MTFLYPASRLIRDIVLEKELKMREGMKAMGLGSGALMASWYLTYVVMAIIQSLAIAAMCSDSIFQVSQ